MSKTLIRGNTFPVKDQLKALGCRWNGEERAWVAFSEEQAAKAQALVAGAPSGWVEAPARQNLPTEGPKPGLDQPREAQNSAQASVEARFDASSGTKGPKPGSEAPSASHPGAKPVVWSPEQEAIFQAAKEHKGNVVVEALAGTGKTFTITHMFPMVPEERLLYLVFNKRNQEEAKGKITDPRVEVRTYNSLGFLFVRQVWPTAKPDDEVEDYRVDKAVGTDTAQEVKTQVKRLAAFLKNLYVQPTLEEAVDVAQERDIEAPGFEQPENGGWDATKLAQHALKVLDLSMEKDPEGRISFNDQVWLAVRMGWVRAWFDFIAIDECQDTNIPQLVMVQRAVKPGGRVFVVGDANQAIYNFRGAASDGMDYMKQQLKAAALGLTVTRRCGKRIVAEAQRFVPHYKAADDAPEGEVVSVPESAVLGMVKPGEAVLSRVNAPLMGMCLQLLKAGTPARIQGRDVGRSLAAVVRKLRARNVPQFLEKLEAWAGKQKQRFAKTKRYEQKCEEINDTWATLAAVAEGSASVAEIEQRLERLFADTGDCPQVVLSSVHRAKGLEWGTVYLLRRTFNRRRPLGTPPPSAKEAREERNIQYVAITRAKTRLVWAEEVRGPNSIGRS